MAGHHPCLDRSAALIIAGIWGRQRRSPAVLVTVPRRVACWRGGQGSSSMSMSGSSWRRGSGLAVRTGQPRWPAHHTGWPTASSPRPPAAARSSPLITPSRCGAHRAARCGPRPAPRPGAVRRTPAPDRPAPAPGEPWRAPRPRRRTTRSSRQLDEAVAAPSACCAAGGVWPVAPVPA